MTDKPKAEIHLDFETCSELDLRKCGVYTYAEHTSTKVLAVSWQVYANGWAAEKWSWRLGESKDALIPLIKTMRDYDYTIHAWNAEFEWVIWRVFHKQHKSVAYTSLYHYPIPDAIPVDRMRCTMLRALYWGLPGNLDQAGEALRLPQSLQKDKEGQRLMMQMNKPRTKRKGSAEPTWWHEDPDQGPDKLKRLSEYCDQDVATEIAIGERVGPVPGSEQKLWELNCEMNKRGVAIDRKFVEDMIHKGEFLTGELDAEMTRITGGDVTKCSQVARLLTWMSRQPGGGNIPDCSRETMERVVNDTEEITPVKMAAACRLGAAKSSVRKFQKMIDVAGETPGRLLRGLTQHYGAGRTGRYAGRLVQPQNLPRPTLTPDEIAKFRKNPRNIKSLEQIASLIRSSIVPRKQADKFLIGDFAQIEARVLAWLANQKDVLEAFAKGEDVYKLTASKVLGKPVAGINDSERHLGKVLTLACGYGMGPGRFQETAASYGIDLSAELAETYVQDWRTANPRIVKYWKHCDNGVASVLTSTSATHNVCVGNTCVKFEYPRDSTILRIRLPSGRRLMYREPEYEPGFEGNGFSYMGLNSYTHKWERIRSYGAKIVENVVQAVARDVMARSLWNVHSKTAYTPMLTVHDELVCETGELSGITGLQTMMEDQPAWAPGLPIEAEVKEARYYGK